jgi:hypothetical protein
MLDISDPTQFKQVSVVSFGKDQDDFGKIHLEGDHKVRVLNVSDAGLEVDPRFQVVDFNTAFATGPARPHGVGMR